MRSLKLSDPEGEKLFEIASHIAMATSPQRWFGGGEFQENKAYQADTIQLVKQTMAEMLDGGIFRDFITRL